MSLSEGEYVLTQEGCVHCENFKEAHKKELENGKIKEIKLSSIPEDSDIWNILETLNVTGTPEVLKVDGESICKVDRTTMQPTSVCASKKVMEATSETTEDFIMGYFSKND